MTLNSHGVDISAMQRLGGVPTSASILNVRPNRDRPVLRFAQASAALVASGLGSDVGILSFDDTRNAMESLPLKGT